MYLVIFIIGSLLWDDTKALGNDGLKLMDNKRTNYQLNFGVPLMHETIGQSAIQGIKDMQRSLQRDQMKSLDTYDGRSYNVAQTKPQTFQSQNRFSTESARQNMNTQQYMQINARVAPFNAYREQVSTIRCNSPFLNEQQRILNCNSLTDSLNSQRMYQNQQPESFSQYQRHFENRQSVLPQQFSNVQHRQVLSRQFSNGQQQQTVPQIPSNDQKRSIVFQGSSSVGQQFRFAQESSRGKQQLGLPQRSYKNTQDLGIPQKFNSEEVLSVEQMLNSGRQQAVLPRRFHESQSRSFFQQPSNAKEAAEIRDHSENQLSNQKGQRYDSRRSNGVELLKALEGNLQALGFDNKQSTVLSRDVSDKEVFPQNSSMKDNISLTTTVMKNAGISSIAVNNRAASLRHHLKTPYVNYNYDHPL